MARKSQALIAAESEIAQLKTQVGVLMSQLEASNQARASLQDERDTLAMTTDCIPQHFQEAYATLVDERNQLIVENQRLTESCVAAHERCDALEAIVAKSAPQSQRQVSDSKPLPSPAVADTAPTIQVTDFDRAMWAKFQALPRETRLEIIAFARPEWGHVGIHNIVQVRAAWRAAKPISA